MHDFAVKNLFLVDALQYKQPMFLKNFVPQLINPAESKLKFLLQ
jgi:hypothetical protein